MKLNNNENLKIGFSSVGKFNGKTPNPENCAELKILNAEEWMDDGIKIVLKNSVICFINGKDEIAKQNLMKILPVIQKDYIGKNIEDLLKFEFNLAERIN